MHHPADKTAHPTKFRVPLNPSFFFRARELRTKKVSDNLIISFVPLRRKEKKMKKKAVVLKQISFVEREEGGSTCMNFRQRIFQRNEKLDRDKTNDKQADLIFENPSSSSHFPPTFYPLIIPLKRRIVGRIGKTIGQNIFARSVGGRNWEKGGKEERNNTVCKVIREREKEGKKRKKEKNWGGGGNC